MEDRLRGIITASFLTAKDKQDLIEYFEMLLEKAWKYDELCK